MYQVAARTESRQGPRRQRCRSEGSSAIMIYSHLMKSAYMSLYSTLHDKTTQDRTLHRVDKKRLVCWVVPLANGRKSKAKEPCNRLPTVKACQTVVKGVHNYGGVGRSPREWKAATHGTHRTVVENGHWNGLQWPWCFHALLNLCEKTKQSEERIGKVWQQRTEQVSGGGYDECKHDGGGKPFCEKGASTPT